MVIEIHLKQFTGPLDLLLHLIKSNEMDIYDIRIVEITEQYLAAIEQMKQLDLDIAGEFLLMAATLIHIKSRTLLPASDDVDDEEGVDPREELIRRLLEYQRYKDAAEMFQQLPHLDRDVFSNHFEFADLPEDEDDSQVAVGVFQLTQAFHRLMKEKPVEVFHEVVEETLSIVTYIEQIIDHLKQHKRRRLKDLVSEKLHHEELVVIFLAMLELVKMRMINVEQAGVFSDVWLSAAVPVDRLSPALLVADELSYG